MSSASRATRRRALSKRRSSPTDLIPYVLIGAGALALFALAFLLSRPDTATDPNRIENRETANVAITGTSLPAFEQTQRDPAVGMAMPELKGVDFTGRHVSVSDDGDPKILMFLAHWCPHCQAEVPVIQDWLDSGATHGDLDLVSIVTGTDQTKPNYPPSEWLDREGWTAPVILDDATSSAGQAAGVTSYPFFVFVDEDGNVTSRAAGELTVEAIEAAAGIEH